MPWCRIVPSVRSFESPADMEAFVAEVRQRPDTSRRLIQNIEVQLTGLARGGSREIMCTWYKVLGRVLQSATCLVAPHGSALAR